MACNQLFYIANVRLPTERAHGIQIMKMCEALAKAGVTVELIVPRRLNSLKAGPFDYYGVKKNFKITRLPIFDTVSLGRVGFWFESFLFLLLARLHLFGKKGMIYTREAATGFFFSDFALELHTLPNKLFFLPRRLFVLTNLLKQELIVRGISSDNIQVLPDAVDLAQFDIPLSKEAARQKLGLPLDKKIVMYTGSFFLYDWKGVDVMLEAAKDFGDEVLLVLVGGSKREVHAAKETWGRDNVLLLGYQTPTSIPVYLKAADVLVIPNKSGDLMSERHTSPLKLFEYMASGRPIICADLASLREVVSDSEVVFFEPNNPIALAQGLKKLLSDSELAEHLVQNARTKVTNFTWDKRARNVLAYSVWRDEKRSS